MATLSEAFDSPYRRAQLHTLLSISDALGSHLPALVDALDDEDMPEWQGVVDALAGSFGRRIGKMTSLRQVDSLWKEFLLDPTVEGLPTRAQAILAGARTALDQHVTAPDRIVEVLDRANARAHQAVRAFLTGSQLEALLAPQPADVRVYSDPFGKTACASTSRGLGYVTWAFQPLPRAIWGVLALDHVLEHEYLSHLAPRSEKLPFLAREVWLVHALIRYHRNSSQDPRKYELKASLTGQFQDLLVADSGVIGGRLVLAGAGLLQRLPKHYDALTADLLSTPLSEAEASQVDQLLRNLAALTDPQLDELGTLPWPGLLSALGVIEALSP